MDAKGYTLQNVESHGCLKGIGDDKAAQ